jgi:hypothetical protein
VALIGLVGRLRSFAMAAALPESRDVTRGIGEDTRACDDLGVLRRVEWNADDVDAEQRRIRILLRRTRRTTRELVWRTHDARAGDVDVNVFRILRVGDERVRVRSATRLNRGYLFRMVEISDVEDANAAEPRGAHRIGDTLRSAVDAAERLLD